MSDICSTFITGHISNEPELRYTSTGTGILSFSLAFNKWRKSANGEGENVGHFIDCKVFGRRAESLAELLCKGQAVAVFGELEQNRWEAKDGGKRSKIEVVVRDVKFQPYKSGDGSRGNAGEDGGSRGNSSMYSDSDIPF